MSAAVRLTASPQTVHSNLKVNLVSDKVETGWGAFVSVWSELRDAVENDLHYAWVRWSKGKLQTVLKQKISRKRSHMQTTDVELRL